MGSKRIDEISERNMSGTISVMDVQYLLNRLVSAEQSAVLAANSEDKDKAKAILGSHFEQFKD